MADDVDRAAEMIEHDLQRRIAATRAAEPPIGASGVCAGCEETMPRLVGGRCGYCRDGRRR